MTDSVTILGQKYTIEKVKYDDDEMFFEYKKGGYCEARLHKLVICDYATLPEDRKPITELSCEIAEKRTLRHEIVHAFFHESGVWYDSLVYDGAWPMNEELVDWIALQGEKIYKAWQEAGAL